MTGCFIIRRNRAGKLVEIAFLAVVPVRLNAAPVPHAEKPYRDAKIANAAFERAVARAGGWQAR